MRGVLKYTIVIWPHMFTNGTWWLPLLIISIVLFYASSLLVLSFPCLCVGVCVWQRESPEMMCWWRLRSCIGVSIGFYKPSFNWLKLKISSNFIFISVQIKSNIFGFHCHQLKLAQYIYIFGFLSGLHRSIQSNIFYSIEKNVRY